MDGALEYVDQPKKRDNDEEGLQEQEYVDWMGCSIVVPLGFPSLLVGIL
jgi:hypothetical protein